jgi:hypothetical protein
MALTSGFGMSAKDLESEHHFARQCASTKLIRKNGAVVGPFPQAFALRDATADRPAETTLSGIWLENFPGSRMEQLAAARDELTAAGRTVRPKDALAVLNVGDVIAAGSQRSMKLRVLHEPMPTSPSYAVIRGMMRDDTGILDLLADLARCETVEICTLGEPA